jgi:hypothetical protein
MIRLDWFNEIWQLVKKFDNLLHYIKGKGLLISLDTS